VVVETLGLNISYINQCELNGSLQFNHLKQYSVVWNVSPKVRDWVAAVAAADLNLEDAVAVQIRADFA
jgi:hypothetical protein